MREMRQAKIEAPILLGNVEGVLRFGACHLACGSEDWAYARCHAADIDVHWLRHQRESPAMFNGAIHLVHGIALEGGVLHAQFLRTDFKSYLYWREHNFPEAGVRDGFGSALVRSAEGHVILGRQRAGNVNAGLAYLPGGFIDPRDVRPDGTIDIDGSILRELEEETGLERADIAISPGYLVTFNGALISIARELRSPLAAEELRARIPAHLARDPASELVDAVIVRTPQELPAQAVAPYAHRLLTWLFAQS